MALRNKQIVFVEAYLRCWNASEAGRIAGYSERSVRAVTSRLLTNANISARIKQRLAEIEMSADEALARLTEHARGSLKPFTKINEDGFLCFDFSGPEAQEHLGLIKKARTRRSRRIVGKGPTAEAWEDESIEIELYDAQNALQLIARHHKLFTDEIEQRVGLHMDEEFVEMMRKAYSDAEEEKALAPTP